MKRNVMLGKYQQGMNHKWTSAHIPRHPTLTAILHHCVSFLAHNVLPLPTKNFCLGQFQTCRRPRPHNTHSPMTAAWLENAPMYATTRIWKVSWPLDTKHSSSRQLYYNIYHKHPQNIGLYCQNNANIGVESSSKHNARRLENYELFFLFPLTLKLFGLKASEFDKPTVNAEAVAIATIPFVNLYR